MRVGVGVLQAEGGRKGSGGGICGNSHYMSGTALGTRVA